MAAKRRVGRSYDRRKYQKKRLKGRGASQNLAEHTPSWRIHKRLGNWVGIWDGLHNGTSFPIHWGVTAWGAKSLEGRDPQECSQLCPPLTHHVTLTRYLLFLSSFVLVLVWPRRISMFAVRYSVDRASSFTRCLTGRFGFAGENDVPCTDSGDVPYSTCKITTSYRSNLVMPLLVSMV
jgi:hypothetical protein